MWALNIPKDRAVDNLLLGSVVTDTEASHSWLFSDVHICR